MPLNFDDFVQQLRQRKGMPTAPFSDYTDAKAFSRLQKKEVQQHLDTLALVGAIVNDSPNGSNLVLAKLVLCAGHQRLKYKGADQAMHTWEDKACLASAFCHGGRIMIDHYQADLYSQLQAGSGIATRRFSTHGMVFDGKHHYETSKKKKGQSQGKKVGKQAYINLAIYGEGSRHPLTGKTVKSNGDNGHLFIMHDDDTSHSKRGAICFGIEGSEFAHADPYGQYHLFGRSSPIGISGSGGKFPNASAILLEDDELPDKYNVLRVDLGAGDKIDFPKDPEVVKRKAVAALFGKQDLTAIEYNYLLTELKSQQLYHRPTPQSIFSRVRDWITDHPIQTAAIVAGGAIVGGIAAGVFVATGGLAAIPVVGTAVIGAVGIASAISIATFASACLTAGIALLGWAAINAEKSPTKQQQQAFDRHEETSFGDLTSSREQQAEQAEQAEQEDEEAVRQNASREASKMKKQPSHAAEKKPVESEEAQTKPQPPKPNMSR